MERAGRAGEDGIGRSGSDHDESEFIRGDARFAQSCFGRLLGQIGRRDPHLGDVSFADARPFQNPFVRRIDQRFEVRIREHSGGGNYVPRPAILT